MTAMDPDLMVSSERADLLSLPAEILGTIFGYVFLGTHMRFLPQSNSDGLDEEEQQRQQEQEGYHSHQSITNQTRCTDLQSLRLTCKSFTNSRILFTEFFSSSTVVVSSLVDIKLLTSTLGSKRSNLVRNICICARDPEPEFVASQCHILSPPSRTNAANSPDQSSNSSHVPLIHHQQQQQQSKQQWTTITVPILLDHFPNLRTLSVKQHGVYIDTFRQDLHYSVSELFAAQRHISSCSCFFLSDTTSHRSPDGYPTPRSDISSPSASPPQSLPTPSPPQSPYAHYHPSINNHHHRSRHHNRSPPRRTTLIPKSYLHTNALHILTHFSHTLATCILRSAPKYNASWYAGLIRDVVAYNNYPAEFCHMSRSTSGTASESDLGKAKRKQGLEMLFTLGLLFMGNEERHHHHHHHHHHPNHRYGRERGVGLGLGVGVELGRTHQLLHQRHENEDGEERKDLERGVAEQKEMEEEEAEQEEEEEEAEEETWFEDLTISSNDWIVRIPRQTRRDEHTPGEKRRKNEVTTTGAFKMDMSDWISGLSKDV